LAIFDHNRPEWTACLFYETTDPAQFNRSAHETGVGGGVACRAHQGIGYPFVVYMGAKLSSHRYGKSRIRVVKILRDGKRHTVVEISAQVLFEGDFERSYTSGDNSKVVATDTIKNTVHVLAKDHLTPEVEKFAVYLAKHFTSEYPQIKKATVEFSQQIWKRLQNHDHSFTASGSAIPWVKVEHIQGAKEVVVESGVKDWVIMKSSQSGFEGYPKCKFTTLPETQERIFASAVMAGWKWAREPKDYTAANHNILEAMTTPFLERFSPSVQTTMYEMGQEALKACPEIAEVSLAMPNKHYHLFNLKPFDLENPNVIFTATDEPHGQIEALIRRS
jgi:urate oxidase